MTIYVPVRIALRVQPSGRASPKVPKNASLRRVRGASPLVEGLLGEYAPLFTSQSRMECAIVGSRVALENEIAETEVAVQGDSGLEDGNIGELLRVNRFGGLNQTYRTEVFSAAAGPNGPLADVEPAVAVFDGAAGFLKWRDCWPRANWIVILSRADPQCRAAASEVDRLFVTRRSLESQDELPVQTSTGLEVAAFGLSDS